MSGARVERFDHDGLTFDVRDEGPLDGEPVVLLHGFPERNTSWRYVAPLLHEQGLRTCALDQRGYSPGARPRRRRDYRVSRLVGDVAALVEQVGGPVHLVGHDWGAVVGWQLASRRPELLRSWTAVSVPHPMAYLRAVATSAQARKSWYIGAFQVPGLVERLARTRRFQDELRKGGMTEEDVERFRSEMVEDDAVRGGLMWYRALPLADLRPGDRTVRVPTTFVWSDRDVAISRVGAEHTPRHVAAPYRFVELRGVSHWVPTQAPEELAAAVLDRVRSVEEAA